MREAILLDIDGVVKGLRDGVAHPAVTRILSAMESVFFVSGNTYEQSIKRIWLDNAGYFVNNADALITNFYHPRFNLGRNIAPLPHIPPPPIDMANNSMEWRSPHFVNVCPVGRYATQRERDNHNTNWREEYIEELNQIDGVEAVLGGQVSVDVYSKGADKSRAGKWLNDHGMTFTFIGDKTDPGGNDYPLVKYCEDHPENKWFKSTGPEHTMEIIRGLQ